MSKELNNQQIKKTLVVNVFLLVGLISIFILLTGGDFLNLNFTGLASKDIYNSNIMYVQNAIASEKTTFIIPVVAQKPLYELYAEIEISDEKGNLMKVLQTEKINVSTNEETELSTVWENNLINGKYPTRISIYSNETSASFTQLLVIEERTLTIESIILSNASEDKQGNLEILVKNHLIEDIDNVNAKIQIYDEKDNLIKEINTESAQVNKSSLIKLNTYLTGEVISEGSNKARISIYADNYSVEKEVLINKTKDKFNIIGTGFTINYSEKESSSNLWIILFFVGIIVLVNFLIWKFNKNT
jgi:hypothetical protein